MSLENQNGQLFLRMAFVVVVVDWLSQECALILCHRYSKLYYSAGCFPTFTKYSLVRSRLILGASAPLQSSDIIIICSVAVCDDNERLKILRTGFIQVRKTCLKQYSCRAKRQEVNVLLILPWGYSSATSSFNEIKNWTQIPLPALDGLICLYSISLCFKYSLGSLLSPFY